MSGLVAEISTVAAATATRRQAESGTRYYAQAFDFDTELALLQYIPTALARASAHARTTLALLPVVTGQ